MTVWWISGVLGFIGGGTFIWFTKSTIQKAVLGGEELAARFRAAANTLSKK